MNLTGLVADSNFGIDGVALHGLLHQLKFRTGGDGKFPFLAHLELEGLLLVPHTQMEREGTVGQIIGGQKLHRQRGRAALGLAGGIVLLPDRRQYHIVCDGLILVKGLAVHRPAGQAIPLRSRHIRGQDALPLRHRDRGNGVALLVLKGHRMADLAAARLGSRSAGLALPGGGNRGGHPGIVLQIIAVGLQNLHGKVVVFLLIKCIVHPEGQRHKRLSGGHIHVGNAVHDYSAPLCVQHQRQAGSRFPVRQGEGILIIGDSAGKTAGRDVIQRNNGYVHLISVQRCGELIAQGVRPLRLGHSHAAQQCDGKHHRQNS